MYWDREIGISSFSVFVDIFVILTIKLQIKLNSFFSFRLRINQSMLCVLCCVRSCLYCPLIYPKLESMIEVQIDWNRNKHFSLSFPSFRPILSLIMNNMILRHAEVIRRPAIYTNSFYNFKQTNKKMIKIKIEINDEWGVCTTNLTA